MPEARSRDRAAALSESGEGHLVGLFVLGDLRHLVLGLSWPASGGSHVSTLSHFTFERTCAASASVEPGWRRRKVLTSIKQRSARLAPRKSRPRLLHVWPVIKPYAEDSEMTSDAATIDQVKLPINPFIWSPHASWKLLATATPTHLARTINRETGQSHV